MEYELYGQEFILLDYKICRESENINEDKYVWNEELQEEVELEPEYVHYVTKIVMLQDVVTGKQLIFTIFGLEKEIENLGINSADKVLNKVFNNLVSNEKFLYNNLIDNTMELSCDLYSCTGISKIGNKVFKDINDYLKFVNELDYIDSYNCLEYNFETNKLMKASFIK